MGTTRTILLVEDDPDLRDAMEQALERSGFAVQAVGDAFDAETALNSGLPCLVITDMMLPGASGFSIIRSVAERSEGQIPVLMISGNTSSAHRDYALAAGANGFLAKPFDLDDLISLALKFCLPPRPTAVELAAMPV